MLKAGRYTAAILLIAVGVGLLLDKTTGSNVLEELVRYWPVLLIAIGAEYLLLNFRTRSGERKIRFDFGGIILAVVISVVVVGFVQGKPFFEQFSINGNWDLFSGKRYEKEVEFFEVNAGTTRLLVTNPNGDVSIVAGDGDRVTVKSTVFVVVAKKEKARQIANDSRTVVTQGSTMTIKAEGETYRTFFGMERKARMDLQITIPRGLELDYELDMKNGDIEIADLSAANELKAVSSNGDVMLHRVHASAELKSSNGDMIVQDLYGDARVRTSNGDIVLRRVDGHAHVHTSNGDIIITELAGHVEAETSNGDINVQGNLLDTEVKSMNGDIIIRSAQVEGDWNVKTSNGDVVVYVPESGHFQVDGRSSRGDVITDLSLKVDKRRLTGTIGNGQHTLELQSARDLIVKSVK